MQEERTNRLLAADLAAVVVGSSPFMQLDEAGTLALLTTRRMEVLQSVGFQHRGRVTELAPESSAFQGNGPRLHTYYLVSIVTGVASTRMRP